ncbi:TetR family transcriptional regulator [Ramlibacter sp. USB13]|uniref:TetR family transcriptional regulator n=1 Tax=Ramlibacter cellulosilyticus TaxID=2764187 RepID=A0A923MNF0_9BURK|nr:TetR family transcriptional regulator [Ramlibacter cellulosilyticus]MBC5781891.1 TetR family transcriptional regulator [Ramlibacter cellulosilyticus]
MVRRTKEEALATRHALLDAAEHVFLAQGVAGTSLNDIAQAAGTTRGAIYWHFKDKADLFNAMMDRVAMPLQGALSLVDAQPEDDPLPGLKKALRAALRQTVNDPQTRRVFEVATHKVEYVDSLCAVRARHLQIRNLWTDRFRHVLLRSAQARGVKLAVPATVAAHGLHALLDGFIQNWLLDPGAFELEPIALKAVDAYLRGIGLG